MIFDFTDQEKAKLEAIDSAYEKLLQDCDDKIIALRPDEVEPVLPERPKSKSRKAMDKYREAEVKAFDDWIAGGTDEWRAERERYFKLQDEKAQAMHDFWVECERNHFAELNNDTTAILDHAKSQVTAIIKQYYNNIEDQARHGSVRDQAVRATKDSFYLDSNQIIELMRRALHLHVEALADDKEAIDTLNSIIYSGVASSPYVSATEGELWGEVRIGNIAPKQVSDFVPVVRPKNYVTTTDMISKQLFSNGLTVENNPNGVYEVLVSGKKKTQINIYASINYDDLIKSSGIMQAPELNETDWWVHDGIITNLASGNRSMTIDMIYRAMTGKIDDKVHVSDDLYNKIRDSVHKFRGITTITNTLGETPEGEAVFNHREPLVMYKEDEVILNGKRVMAITVPNDIDSDPIVLRWARFNGNEIDTRDIRLLDVKGLNNGDESSTIKMYLYKRVIAMRHAFDEATIQHKPMKMSRKIKLETVYHKLGLEDPSRVKKQRVKEKIDKCLSFWVAGGLITGYTFTTANGSTAYDGVEIDFLPKLEG